MQSRVFFFISVFVLVLALALVTAFPRPFTLSSFAVETSALNNKNKKQITVFAEGEASATADVAYVSLSAVIKNSSVSAAQSQAAAIIADTSRHIISLGIDPSDITTSSYSVNPEYEYKNGSSRQNGYCVASTLRVRLTRLELIGEVVDAAGQSGISGISLQLGIDDTGLLYHNALVNAIAIARKKADLIADSLNISLGSPIAITEQPALSISPLYRTTALSEASTQISPDRLTVKASVEIVFQIN